MSVVVPDPAIDPAALRASVDPLTHAVAVVAAQADTTARAWLGLAGVYSAEEAARLFAALDPLRYDAELHQRRLAGVGTALTELADVAEPIVRQLDELRIEAATAPPEDEPRILNLVQSLLGALDAAEATCAGDVRSALDRPDAPGVDAFNRGINGPLGAAALALGDALAGRGLLDTPLEDKLTRHFTDGTAAPYVFTKDELTALRTDPAVLAAGAQVRAGEGRVVTLEGGTEGRAVAVDFNPAGGRPGINPYDGSLGRATVYFDRYGNVVGLSDVYDFTNDNKAVDQVNALGSVVGARPFHVRAGVIEQQPYEEFLPDEPDGAEARARLQERNEGRDPGPLPLTPRPR